MACHIDRMVEITMLVFPRSCHFEPCVRNLKNTMKKRCFAMLNMNMTMPVFSRSCNFIFVLSLTRFAFRNPNGITCGYATFDLLLQNSSITKPCSYNFIFVLSLAGSFIRDPHGMHFIHATCDQTLMNPPITKPCFVIVFSPCVGFFNGAVR